MAGRVDELCAFVQLGGQLDFDEIVEALLPLELGEAPRDVEQLLRSLTPHNLVDHAVIVAMLEAGVDRFVLAEAVIVPFMDRAPKSRREDQPYWERVEYRMSAAVIAKLWPDAAGDDYDALVPTLQAIGVLTPPWGPGEMEEDSPYRGNYPRWVGERLSRS